MFATVGAFRGMLPERYEMPARNAMLSGRNVDGVTIVRSDQINAFNMLNHRYMVIGRAELEAWLSGPSSQTTKDAKINPLGRKADASKGGK